jgi:hypothetical protein
MSTIDDKKLFEEASSGLIKLSTILLKTNCCDQIAFLLQPHPICPNQTNIKHIPINPVKKIRKRYNKLELQKLEMVFSENHWPSKKILNALASDCNCTTRTVQIWFQNRRSKNKKQAKLLVNTC